MKSTRHRALGSLLALAFLSGCFNAAPWNTPALQLWKTDGTSAGAAFVRRFPMRLEWNWLTPVALGDQVLFTLTDGRQGVELWRSDGSVDGTVKVLDLSPGKAEVGGVGPVPDAILAVGKTLFFTFADGVHGPELWKTDGTAEGTGLVKDILPGATGSFPRQFARIGQRLLFVDADPSALWSSDGTPEGTVQLAAGSWSLGASAVVGDALLYRAGGSSDETNTLWRSDGTASGTTRVGDFPVGPANCVAARGLLFCDVLGELWTSDGTVGNARRVATIQGIQSDSLIGAGQRVYFATATDGKDRQLWTSDGSAEGTVSVASFPDLGPQTTFGAGFARGEPTDLTPLGDVLYFAGRRPETGYELWRSDGTVAGTRLVMDLEPGPTDSFPSSLRALGGRRRFPRDARPLVDPRNRGRHDPRPGRRPQPRTHRGR